jgi:pimeloyl-ACP methyl ester carboxylesterase
MGTFVLVHGAFLGGWCWSRVRDQLQAQGHQVYTPSLTGLGDRTHLLSGNINLQTHVDDVIGVIDSYDLEDVVLCGHSYGGLVITGAGNARADKIKSLVYLDALVPEDGQSMFDTVPQAFIDRFEEATAANDGISTPPMTAEEFGTWPENVEWVNAHSSNHPTETFRSPVCRTAAWDSIGGKHFILAPAFEHPSTHGYYNELKGDPNWQTHELEGGHHLMVDNPDGVTGLLLKAREANASRSY